MAQMIETRNALVEVGSDPEAPEVRDVGVEIRFAVDGDATFPVGEPAVLHGAYSADRELLEYSRYRPASGIFLTVIRTDRATFGRTVHLIAPVVSEPPPEPDGEISDTYRESAQFKVDLVQFFELPARPATYAIQATFGPAASARESFAVVEPESKPEEGAPE